MAQVRIDGAKLAATFDRRGLSKAEVSRAIGFSDNYWTKACKMGECSMVAMTALETMYRIIPDEYRLAEDKPEPAPEQTDLLGEKIIAIDADSFKAAVYEAVKQAMLDVFKAVGEAKKRMEGLE